MNRRSNGDPRQTEQIVVHGVMILAIDRHGYEVDRMRVVPRRRMKRREPNPRRS
jgi:hypothetical protein